MLSTAHKLRYRSDLTDAEWELIEPLLPKSRRKYESFSVRETLNAIFYKQETGCTWRELPREFPSHKLISFRRWKWHKSGFFHQVYQALYQRYGQFNEEETMLDTTETSLNGHNEQQQWYTVSQVAYRLQLEDPTIYKAITGSQLQAEKRNNRWQISQEAFDAFKVYRQSISSETSSEQETQLEGVAEVAKPATTQPLQVADAVPVQSQLWTTRTVNLKSGGCITISYQVDLFEADAEDRKLLLEIIDAIRRYQP